MSAFTDRVSKFAVGFRRQVRRHPRGLTVAIVAVAFTGFFVLLWWGASLLGGSGLHGLTPAQKETAIDAIRGRLLQLGAGLLASVALLTRPGPSG
jgi:hypothetical protein